MSKVKITQDCKNIIHCHIFDSDSVWAYFDLREWLSKAHLHLSLFDSRTRDTRTCKLRMIV